MLAMHKSLVRTLPQWVFVGNALLAAAAHAQLNASSEYALIGYENEPRDNPVGRMQDDLLHGKLSLEFGEERGYFDALLDALDIDADSQVLVFSATSLQRKLISPATPRSLYFNDSTYLGLVQNSSIVEVVTVDDSLGIVFYTFDNTEGTTTYFERNDETCLTCHDSQGAMGGGVPMLLALSSVYSDRNVPLKTYSGRGSVGDQTPIKDRWGGWYVTGRHGLQAHLGNLLLKNPNDLEQLDDFRVWNLESLKGAGYFDTSPYLRDTSDIVALMVLEHQVTVQNQITYIKFKAPAVLIRRGMEDGLSAQSWDELPAREQETLTRMLDKLVKQLVFLDAAYSVSPLSGSQKFVADFAARGPQDAAGRSLRELDLDKRLFRYPLSYLVYTSDFATMPAYAKDYVYRQLAAYLAGRKSLEGNSQYSLADRRAALEILADTQSEFRPYLASYR
jgi:hypothetical protein